MTDTCIWTEKYCPTNLNDIVSHKLNIQILEKLIEKKNIPHIIFHGRSGVGKTSTVVSFTRKIYENKFSSSILELNASDERGIEVIREKIKTFASTKNLFNKNIKFIILDEADLMTNDAQLALKKIIDIYIHNCRFCILCNNINKIIPELQSRCMKIRFKPIKYEDASKKLTFICNKENINITKSALDIIINHGEHDLRKMINLLQSFYLLNKTKIIKSTAYKFLNIMNDKEQDSFIEIIKTQPYISIYDKIKDYIKIYNYSITDIINYIFKMITKIYTVNEKTKVILTNAIIELADLEYKISTGCDYHIASGYIVSILWDIREII